MYKIFCLLSFLFMSSKAFGQDNYDKFVELFQQKDTTAIVNLLQKWETENPNDPEFYTCAFNYYFANSRQEILSLQQKKPQQDAYQLTDSAGNNAGFLSANMAYEPKLFAQAIAYANKGIEKFPNRLDIWFGKCFALGEAEDYTSFTNTILQVVDQSKVNKNKWLWTKNDVLEDSELFMLNAIHTYQKQLYETEDDALLPNMILIGEKTLKHYPKTIEILSTTAIAYILTEQYDKAIGILKKAEKLNPVDYIVLNNIAQAYRLKGDKQNALKYYELTIRHGDKQAQDQANYYIELLNAKE